jgi:hypothetical protein
LPLVLVRAISSTQLLTVWYGNGRRVDDIAREVSAGDDKVLSTGKEGTAVSSSRFCERADRERLRSIAYPAESSTMPEPPDIESDWSRSSVYRSSAIEVVSGE